MTDYQDLFPEQLFEALKHGDTVVEFCQVIGIARIKFYRWQKRYVEFAKAFEDGRDAAKEIWLVRCIFPGMNKRTGRRYPNTSYHRFLATNIYGKDFLPPKDIETTREQYYELLKYRVDSF